MNVVLDTNVLVSALCTPGRRASQILSAVIVRRLTACYDSRILEEYDRVLHYPKFAFSEWEIRALMEPILRQGLSVIPEPLRSYDFPDESDRKFLEVARACGAVLITGNLRYFPTEPDILSISDFCERLL